MKQWLIYPGLALIGVVVLHFAVGVRWGISAFAILVGWPLIGTLVTLDDDLRGGWSNPDGAERLEWLMPQYWGRLSAGVAISSVITATNPNLRTSEGIGFAVAGLAAGFLAFVLLRRPVR